MMPLACHGNSILRYAVCVRSVQRDPMIGTGIVGPTEDHETNRPSSRLLVPSAMLSTMQRLQDNLLQDNSLWDNFL